MPEDRECACGRGPVVAVLMIVGPQWYQGPEVCEQCEDDYFEQLAR